MGHEFFKNHDFEQDPPPTPKAKPKDQEKSFEELELQKAKIWSIKDFNLEAAPKVSVKGKRIAYFVMDDGTEKYLMKIDKFNTKIVEEKRNRKFLAQLKDEDRIINLQTYFEDEENFYLLTEKANAGSLAQFMQQDKEKIKPQDHLSNVKRFVR